MGNCCVKWCPCCSCSRKESHGPRIITPNIALPKVPVKSRFHPNRRYRSNRVKTAKYTAWNFIPLNLFKQFHAWTNWYFLSIVIINFIPAISAFANFVSWIPIAIVLICTATKDAIEDYQRTKSDSRLNHTRCRVYRNGQYESTTWQLVYSGDILRVNCNEAIPADVLLLRSSDPLGVCFVETANLDGETNLKQREVLKCFRGVDFVPESIVPYRVQIEAPNSEVYHINGTCYREDSSGEVKISDADSVSVDAGSDAVTFSGNQRENDHSQPGSSSLLNEKFPINKENVLLRGCKLRNTDYIEGLVIYAGHDTKMMMNDDGPRFKRSRLELRIQQDTLYCGVLLLILCLGGAAGDVIWQRYMGQFPNVPFLYGISDGGDSSIVQGVITFFIYLIYLQNVIPLPLFISQELVKVLQIVIMENDKEMYHAPSNRKLACRSWNLSEDLGQIQYVFTDKTGTLTENVMTFRRCVVNGFDYNFEDYRLESSESAGQKIGCTFHASVTGVAPCPHCSANVPPLQDRELDIRRMSLQTLLDTPQIQIGTASSYTPLPLRPSSALTAKMHENTVSFLHHYLLTMALCNTVVVSATNHHEAKKKKKLSLSMRPDSAMSDAQSRTEEEEELMHLLDSYEAESADELALVKASCVMGVILMKRTNDRVVLKLPAEAEPVEFRVLKILPFDSDRKRMSIIVQHPINKAIILYCKGADTSVLPVLSRQYEKASNPTLVRTKHVIDEYAKLGLRTLCFAKRVLTEDEYERWSELYDEAERATEDRAKKFFEAAQLIETNFTLLGAAGIEDKLQEQVPETIEALRQANMNVWMLTGDKQETAINIGYSCRLLDSSQKLLILNESDPEKTARKIAFFLRGIERMKEKRAARQAQELEEYMSRMDDEKLSSELPHYGKKAIRKMALQKVNLALVVDGATLKHVLDNVEINQEFVALASQCKSVLCSRTTPLQKASIVKLVMQKLGKYALAIGDGANDVSMIKTANVGIGITGREGLQASMASDYAIAKFKYLKRLLLVHGHWSYHRFSLMALLIFYKQIIWTMMFFWYQLFNGYSAIVMIDQMYQVAYTVIMSALPPIYIGVLDQIVSAEALLREPALYKQSQKGRYYQPITFWIYFADGLWQSVAVFFLGYLSYVDSKFGIWEFGLLEYFTAITAVIAVCCVETSMWNFIGVLCTVLSIGGTWLFPLLYNALQGSATGVPPDNPYWVIYNHAQTIEFWTMQLAIVVVCVLPRVTAKILWRCLGPTRMDLSRLEQMEIDEEREKAQKEAELKAADQCDHSNCTTPTTDSIGTPSRFGWRRLKQMITPSHSVTSPPTPSSSRSVPQAPNSLIVTFDNRNDEPEAQIRVEVTLADSGIDSPAETPPVLNSPLPDLLPQAASNNSTRRGLPPLQAAGKRNNSTGRSSDAPVPSPLARPRNSPADLRIGPRILSQRQRRNRVGTVPEETGEELHSEAARQPAK